MALEIKSDIIDSNKMWIHIEDFNKKSERLLWLKIYKFIEVL